MDACHILLGRPWQYDRYVKYDERENVYIATVGKKRTTLKPLTTLTKPKQVLFLNEQQFESEFEQERKAFILLANPTTDANKWQVSKVLAKGT